VVDPGGIVRAAAVFLNAPIGNLPMRPGLGARHAAALAATRDTGAVAVVVSSSSGTITVFQEGRLILELEKP
jgi:DNA integrity scanning protein DisA with diadenylate cyclase activity